MRNRSSTWAALTSQGNFACQPKVTIDGVDYDQITAPVVERSTGSGPLEIGNVVVSTLQVDIKASERFDAQEKITVYARLYDDTRVSEWKRFGVFFIDQQIYNSNTGIISITAYDALEKSKDPYCLTQDASGTWPKTFKTAVEEIAQRIGVGIDPRVRIPSGTDYYVTDPYVDNFTMYDVLANIGACLGGNWIITDEGLLRLVPLVSTSDNSFAIIDRENRIVIDRTGNTLVWATPEASGEEEVDITTTVRPGDRPTSYVPIGGSDSAMGGEDGTLHVAAVLGTLTSDGEYGVYRVCLEGRDSIIYGNSSAILERKRYHKVIKGRSVYATRAIQQSLEATYRGMLLNPYEATSCVYDPCVEPGDQVRFGSILGTTVLGVLIGDVRTFGISFRGDLRSPSNEDLRSEYKIR